MKNTNTLRVAKALAKEELKVEEFERLVEKEKARLKMRVPFWHRVFPLEVTIRRRSWLIGKQQ